MLIQTGRMANSSYVDFFMPMKENGANVNPVDAIGGGTLPTPNASVGDGSSIIFGDDVSATLTGGTIANLDKNHSFIVSFGLSAISINAGRIEFGQVGNGSYVSIGYSFGTLTVFASFADIDSGGSTAINFDNEVIADPVNHHIYSFAFDRNANKAYFLVDGVVSADELDVSGVAYIDFMLGSSNLRYAGVTGHSTERFVFTNAGLPGDYKAALIDMAARRINDDMRIYPPWELK